MSFCVFEDVDEVLFPLLTLVDGVDSEESCSVVAVACVGVEVETAVVDVRELRLGAVVLPSRRRLLRQDASHRQPRPLTPTNMSTGDRLRSHPVYC